MGFQSTWPWMLLALSRFFLTALARECVFTDPEDTFFYENEDAYYAFDGCSTIVAETINISPIYDRLYLPDVINITGIINVSHWTERFGYPSMPAIEMPNLEYLGALRVRNVTALQNITMPKLKEVTGNIDINASYERLLLDFWSLKRAPAIRVVGRLDELNFDSLQMVDNDLIITNCGACDTDWEGTDALLQREDGLVLSFRSLVSVGCIKISGYLRTIGVANLVSAGPPTNPGDSKLSTDSGARFYLTQVMGLFSLNLTKLESVDKQLYIWGKMGGLSMPALKNADAAIHVDASAPLDIDLPLETANSIDLLGHIISVHLPSLSPNTNITLSSTYECDSHEPLTNVTYPIPSSGLSKGGRIGMGVGIAVGVSVVILAVFFCCRRSRRKKAERRELTDLPAYGPGSALPLRPDTPPPPYSVRPT